MPWTVTDVDSHKKGLSDKQKKQWVRIANSVLKREMAKGKVEKLAAASAIKQANGAVITANESKGKYSVYKNKQILDYEVKLAVHQEKAHLVIPVVMMVEGVHNGNQGPLLHTINELGKYPDTWNGIPVVIYHPEEDGNAISANSPDIIDKRTVGRVYNTYVEGNKLKAEVWLDEDKLNAISEDTLQDINDTKEVEVSLGMFTENEMVEGKYGDEAYIGIAHNHRPDHLAILPDKVGACSCADGCGLGANEDLPVIHESVFPNLSRAGYSFHQITNYVEKEYQKRISMAYDALRSLDVHVYNYLEELYDDYLIYSQSGEDKVKMYKQAYKIESGKIEFMGTPTEVHRKVEYVVNSGLTKEKISINNKKEENKMADKCAPCIEKKVTDLIGNNQGFAETDREMLQTLTEPQLDKLFVKKEDPKPGVNEGTEKKVEKTEKPEEKPPVQILSAEDQAALAYGKKQLKDRKERMVKGILDNTEKNVWDEKSLNSLTEDMLERVYNSVYKEEEKEVSGNYTLNSGRFNSNFGEIEPLLPAGVELKK